MSADDNFKSEPASVAVTPKDDVTNTPLAVAFLLLNSALMVLVTATNKHSQNLGIGPIELGFIRAIILLVFSVVQMRFNNQHFITGMDPDRNLY